MSSFGFIIPCFIDNDETYQMLVIGLKQIREFHQEPIVLVNNHSRFDLTPILSMFSNLSIELSPVPNCGEVNGYLVFHEKRPFDIAIILHDSMHLQQQLVGVSDIKTVKFIKYFDDHIHNWSKVKEPRTEYNIANGIRTHDDLILHLIGAATRIHPKFWDHSKSLYRQKRRWVGCYGIMSIIHYDFLDRLVDQTQFVEIAKSLKDKRDRMAFESIFPIMCLFFVPLSVLTDSYDGNWKENGKWMHQTKNFHKISKGR